MSAVIFILGVVLFFLGILASVALHEIGHMWPAKKFGVKVTQYFVGFGRTVWSTRRGETEYGVKAIPLGGFVRLVGMFPPPKGEDPTKVRKANTGPFQSLIENARHAEYEQVSPDDADRLFYRKPWWQKLIVMTGGPMMNVLIAFVLFGGLFMLYGAAVPQTTVRTVTDCVIRADDAGPDRVCQNGDPISPAKKAGFKPGDTILAFNGTAIDEWDDLTPLIRNNANKPATILVERDGQQLTLKTETMLNQVYEKEGSDKIISVGFLGVSPERKVIRQDLGFTMARMGDLTVASVKALANFPAKLVGVAKAVAGDEREKDSPMSIVGASRVAGEVVSADQLTTGERIAFFISLLASVNLFIALFNFLPLLPLDGGHIAGAIWEGIKRGFAKLFGRPAPLPVDVAKLLPVAYVAASFIIVMGGLLIIADIVNPIRLFNG